MMNKIKSAKIHLLRFTFLLPLMAIILLSFRNELRQRITRQNEFRNQPVVLVNDTVPKAKNNFKLQKDVQKIQVKKNLATVYLRSGLVEKYNLDKEEERLIFEKKYGEIPPPPPPAPPVPPMPPKMKPENVKDIHIEDDLAKVYLRNGQMEKYNLKDATEKKIFEKKYGRSPSQPLLPPAPPAEYVKKVPQDPPTPPVPPLPEAMKDKNVKRVEINNGMAKVYLRNGKTEVYNLKNIKEKELFEKKYGTIQNPPPPPPAPDIED